MARSVPQKMHTEYDLAANLATVSIAAINE